MKRDPLATVSTRSTPQSRRADARQVPNSAGGFTFQLDDLARLRRFLLLGVDGGTYYARDVDLAVQNAEVVTRLASSNHRALVDEIVAVSEAGRAPRQQPTLFALAVACSHGEPEERRYALDRLARVARTGTHLLTFVRYVEQFRGWGRALKRGVAAWYLDPPVEDVAFQCVKYRQRDGWSQRDVLRLAHPKVSATDYPRRAVFDWVAHRERYTAEERLAGVDGGDAPRLLEGFERAQAETNPARVADLVREYRLPREALPDAALALPATWEALLDNGMPQTALIRQLPKLTRLGLLTPLGARTRQVCAQLTDPDRLRRGRVHPVNVLVAHHTYASGVSERGASTWQPSRPVVDALDAAFYAAFAAVEPTGRRLMLALDVSGSMSASVGGTTLSCREVSAALALVTAATESTYELVGFTAGSRPTLYGGYPVGLTPLAISPRQRLADAVRAVSRLSFGGTDCALPMIHALENDVAVDTFVIYTDHETWYGDVHPHQALRRYRERTGIPARLVVVGLTATGFTIADPTDAGMLDVVGFDSALPNLIADFARED